MTKWVMSAARLQNLRTKGRDTCIQIALEICINLGDKVGDKMIITVEKKIKKTISSSTLHMKTTATRKDFIKSHSKNVRGSKDVYFTQTTSLGVFFVFFFLDELVPNIC